MKAKKFLVRTVLASAILFGSVNVGSSTLHAATPLLETNNGAFVKIVGNPSEGTVKFQFGWSAGTDASIDAVGYWVGVYDITRSTYVWVVATDEKGAMDLPDQFFRNARPTTELPVGEYKVNFFVRDSYGEPVTNVAEIELEFSVTSALPRREDVNGGALAYQKHSRVDEFGMNS